MRASLKRAIGKLCAGAEGEGRTGTAFLVTREHLFTALHVVADRQHVVDGHENSLTIRLQFTFDGEEMPCEVELVPGLYDPYDDWAVLKLFAPRDDIVPISLGLLCDGLDTAVEAFGYPAEHGSLTVAGHIRDSQASYHGSPALQIYSEEAAAGVGSPLNGLSGAPCLVGGLAVGIVRAHPVRRDMLGAQPLVTVRNGTLYACPIALPAAKLPQLLASARRLDVDSVKWAISAQEHISSFQRYDRALRRFALNNTYGLGAARRVSLDEFPWLDGALENREPAAAVKLIGAVLADSRMAVLEGDAGSGKSSTLLAFAAQAWSHSSELGLVSPLLPMFVRMRDLAEASGASASDRLASAIGKLPAFAMEGAGLSAQFLLAWPESMEAEPILLLDALDEVPDQHRLEAMQWLGTILEQMPMLRLVISTRSLNLLRGSCFEMKEAAPRVRLMAPTQDLAVRIAAAYLGQGPSDLIEKLQTAGLTDITATPLATALSATVYAERGVLPTHRAALYKDYVDVALKKAFPTGQIGGTGFSSGQAQHFLEIVAWSATCSDIDGQETILQALVDGVVAAGNAVSMRAARLRADELLQQLAEHSGVLVGKSGEWRHETFREYFAAQHLAAELDSGRLRLPELVGRHTQTRWRGTLLFLFNIWSSRAKTLSEQQLAIYLPVFDTLIGVEKGQMGKWLASMRITFGLGSAAAAPSPTEDSLGFAAEAVVELGRAPQRVEERILELLMARSSTIGDTFKNLCRMLFSEEGKSERRALGRWADDSRLKTRLAPWVARWLLDLQAECEDAAGVAGLVLLCHGEHQLERLLDRDALTPDACAKLVRVCRFQHHQRWNLVSVKAVDSLLRRIKASEELLNQATDWMDVWAGSNVEWPEDHIIRHNKFLRRVLAMKEVENVLKAHDKHPKLAAQLLSKRWQSLRGEDSLELADAVQYMGSSRSILDSALESMINDPADVFEPVVPQRVRAYARWYFNQSTENRGTFALTKYVTDQLRAGQRAWEAFDEAAKEMEVDALLERISSDSTTPQIGARIAQVIAQQHCAHGDAVEYVCRVNARKEVRLAVLETFANAAMTPARIALVAIYSQELAITPSDTVLLRKRAAQLDDLQDWSAFEHDLAAILALDKDDSQLHLDRARALINLDRPQEALSSATLVNHLNPISNFAHYIRGRAFQDLQRYREALEAYDKAISLDFAELRVFRKRTESLYALGLVEDALRYVKEVLREYPNDGSLIECQVMILSILGKNAESDQLISELNEDPCELGFWDLARLQNALIAGRHVEFSAIADDLARADRIDGWVRLLQLCMAVKVSGRLSISAAKIMQIELIKPASPSQQVLFFCFIGDNSAARAQLDSLIEIKNESEIRWMIVCAKGILASLLPPSADAIIIYAESGLRLVEIELAAQTISDSEADISWSPDKATQAAQVAPRIFPFTYRNYVVTSGLVFIPHKTGSYDAHSVLNLVNKRVGTKLARDLKPEINSLLKVVTAPVHEAPQITPVKRTKYLFAKGMKCEMQGILSYDEEKEICDHILSRYNGQRVMVIIPLLQTGHVYIQANVRENRKSEYDLKICADFAKLRDYGVFTKLMQDHRFSKVVVTDPALQAQIARTPTLSKLQKCMLLSYHALPYTSDLVTWEMCE